MANTKSAKAKVREINNKTEINKSVRNRYRTYIKKVELNIVKKDKSSAQQALKSAAVSYTHLTLPTICSV